MALRDAATPPTPTSPVQASRRILIVDDNVGIHRDFAKILCPPPNVMASEDALASIEALLFDAPPAAHESFDLEFAHGGEEALAKVRASLAANAPFALAFVDIRMPGGLDGIETTAALWEIDPRVQIILCSAYSDYSWNDITARLGVAKDFLILKKPFEVIEVLQMAHAMTQKWALVEKATRHVEELEREVARRTADLAAANLALQVEMANRLRLEKETRHNQKLEALGRLAAGVGHEINNPLTFIVGNIEFCRERLATVVDDDVRDALVEMADGAERIRRIVRGIHKFSLPSEDPLGPVDVVQSMKNAQRLVAGSMRHHVTLVEQYADVPAVLGERHQLEQVLVNIIVNATHAMPPTRATTNELRMVTREADGDVIVEITDNGVGIAEADLERVFDPFFTTRVVGEGTGLGLSISRGIVVGFGGSIAIESQLGKGTTVRIRLKPAGEIAAPAPPPPRASSGRTGRILLVDDEQSILKVASRVLSAFDVSTTTNGAEAVARYKESEFDLVLCDVMMPAFSGMDVYAELSKLGPEHARRMVFLTGGAFTEQSAAFLESISNPHLSKPFSAVELRRLVEAQLAAIRDDGDIAKSA